MKILFLIPPVTSYINRDFAESHRAPSYGVASMIGNIQNRFPEINFIDAYAERLSLKKTIERIVEFRPDVLAVSALTIQIHDAAAVVRALRERNQEFTCVVGGSHTSKIPEDTLREFDCFDYVVAGEGEETLPELIDAIGNGGPTDKIKGLYALLDGEIVSGGVRPFIEDLDSLELPEWKHFRRSAYRPIFSMKSNGVRELTVSSTRGCPHNCIFCSKIMGNKVRKKSIGRVVEEIGRDVEDYGASRILFTDETFTVFRRYALELCEEVMANGLSRKILWACNTRPDSVDEELIRVMKAAGCDLINFGVDSLSEESMSYINKKASREQIFAAVKLCRKHGVKTEAAYIIGMPTDTEDSIRETVREAIKLNSDFATFAILVPYPGTRIMELAEKNEDGLILLSKDWRLYGKQLGHALETEKLGRLKLEKLQRMAYRKYYLRPRKFINVFKLANVRIFLYFISHALKMAGAGNRVKK